MADPLRRFKAEFFQAQSHPICRTSEDVELSCPTFRPYGVSDLHVAGGSGRW
jgi:hypothetical protein